jgi:hypothetical protein
MKKKVRMARRVVVTVLGILVIVPAVLFFLFVDRETALELRVKSFLLNKFTATRPETSAFLRKEPYRRTKVTIPVRYLPRYEEIMSPDGSWGFRETYGEATVDTYSDDVALIIIDMWGEKDRNAPTELEAHIMKLVEECRANGVTVIHAPSYPIVAKYPQYHAIREEVDAYLNPADPVSRLVRAVANALRYLKDGRRIALYRWPSPRFFKHLMRERIDESERLKRESAAYEGDRSRFIKPYPDDIVLKSEGDISRFLKPLPDDIVLESRDQLRYLLWLRDIKVLLYAGSSANECLLHRNAGINYLAGTDSYRTSFVIVVLSDCTVSMSGPWDEEDVTHTAIMDYYMRKIAFVADSSDIVWGDE